MNVTKDNGRARHLMTLFAACALFSACATEVSDGEVAGEGEELILQGELYDPDEVCDFRLVLDAGPETLQFPYCATADLAPGGGWGPYEPFDDVRTLVVSQHGRGSDGQKYLNFANQTISRGQSAGYVNQSETFVIAPQFIQPWRVPEVYPSYWNNLFVWNQGEVDYDWAVGGMSSWPGAPGSRSSFDILEELLDRAIARMPNLEEIIFVGQSAGGQFVQRYAILNDYDFPEDVHVRYVPTNAWAYAWPTDERRDHVFGGYETPNMGVSWKYYPDNQVCPPTADYATCEDYDTFQRGLGRVPADHWAASVLPTFGPAGSDPDYVENVDILGVGLRYRARDVTYLVAENDVLHADMCNCGDQMQGESTRERARQLSHYMKTEWSAPGHDVVVVPDTGHGGQNIRSQCGVATVFGHPEDCIAGRPYNFGYGLGGDVVSIAYGNVDDDAADEVAVVVNQGFGGRVLVLDDAAHRFAILFEPSASWGFLQIPREVAFGDVDTSDDGRMELGVVRSTSSGDSWFVYRRSDYGTWSVMDSGGADWPSPRSAYHLAFGDIDGSGDDELIVARHASSGPRFYYYGVNRYGNLGSEYSQGTYWGSTYVNDLACGDTDGDGDEEIGVGLSATSGARARVYHMNGRWVQSIGTIGSGWRTGHVVRHLTFGNMDEDEGAEMVIGRSVYPGYDRWLVMDDASQGYAVVLGGGRNSDPGWPDDAYVTDVAFGLIDNWSLYPTIAISAISAEGPVLEIAAMEVTGDEDLVVGDFSRPEIDADIDVRSVAFGDVEGGGGDEIVFGVDDAEDVGWAAKALPTL